ncbi:o-succinylbenzoate synthase [Shewanella sp. SR44-3]|uniref:o-succinylbenzoate synthase n=1 Tax=Shewanella sp. SR44-3 TaxID=2760936 RepID=UPI0015F7FCFB|nr:o-succinylbenzoate synthase [Shewanella sp. SR44-3]MBB1268526.1 o-succinylbenzoate synthase [Shewanella sp. SR44-3]
MIIKAIDLHRYQIALKPHLMVARQRIDCRSGLILTIRLEHKKTAKVERVEIAPLSGLDIDNRPITGFSQESLAQVEQQLSVLLPQLIGQDSCALENIAKQYSHIPSLAFGLSLLCHKLRHPWPPGCFAKPLATQKLLCPVTNPDSLEQQASLKQQLTSLTKQDHFIKIKVAQIATEDEINFIYQVLKIKPDIKLRLDANRGFSLSQAIDFLACLPKNAIDYIEEPCQNPEDNILLFKALGIGYALDESLNDPSYRFTPQLGLNTLVIKPTLLGNLSALQSLIQLAQESGVRCIISSSLESPLAISDLRLLANWLTPDDTPGLDTLASFSEPLYYLEENQHASFAQSTNLKEGNGLAKEAMLTAEAAMTQLNPQVSQLLLQLRHQEPLR